MAGMLSSLAPIHLGTSGLAPGSVVLNSTAQEAQTIYILQPGIVYLGELPHRRRIEFLGRPQHPRSSVDATSF
jgi:hypothetical protein